jgi:hypothetical protein
MALRLMVEGWKEKVDEFVESINSLSGWRFYRAYND